MLNREERENVLIEMKRREVTLTVIGWVKKNNFDFMIVQVNVICSEMLHWRNLRWRATRQTTEENRDCCYISATCKGKQIHLGILHPGKTVKTAIFSFLQTAVGLSDWLSPELCVQNCESNFENFVTFVHFLIYLFFSPFLNVEFGCLSFVLEQRKRLLWSSLSNTA